MKCDRIVTKCVCGKCSQPHEHTRPCGSKWCEICAPRYRQRFRHRYRKVFEVMEHPKLVTLTLKKNRYGHADLPKLVGFSKRARFYLKRKGYPIKKCLWVLEPPNHVHALWDTGFIPNHTLSEVWHAVTGDSYIVDIRKADNRALGYITKYMGKGLARIPEHTRKAAHSNCKHPMHKLHFIGSWGVLKKSSKSLTSPGKFTITCKDCGPAEGVLVDLDYWYYLQHAEPPDMAWRIRADHDVIPGFSMPD